MSLPEEEYEKMRDTAQEYRQPLQKLREAGRISAGRVHRELEESDAREAIEDLVNAGLVEERARSDEKGFSLSYSVTSLGREVLAHIEKKSYSGERDEREEDLGRSYDSGLFE